MTMRRIVESGAPMPFDAFISYSSKDKLIADAACAALEARGVRCWIAPRDILPGEEWPAAIVKGISASRIMVLIYSGSANESPQIKRELERAVHGNLPILPYRIEAAPMSPSLQYLISTPHWLDAIDPPMEANLKRLGDTVLALLTSLGGSLPGDANRGGGGTGSSPGVSHISSLDYRAPRPRRTSVRGPVIAAAILLALGFAGYASYKYVLKLAQAPAPVIPPLPATAPVATPPPPPATSPATTLADVTPTPPRPATSAPVPAPASAPAAAIVPTVTPPAPPRPSPSEMLAQLRAEAYEAAGDEDMKNRDYGKAIAAYDSALLEYPGLIRVAPKRTAAHEALVKSLPPTPPVTIDPAKPPELRPLIFAAVSGNNIGGAKSILDWKKSEVNTRDKQGRTPLHAVAASPDGTWQMARLLLDNGADHLAKDNDGRTPSDLAKASGNTRVRAILDQILTTRPSK
jgi:hypothetical protein